MMYVPVSLWCLHTILGKYNVCNSIYGDDQYYFSAIKSLNGEEQEKTDAEMVRYLKI